MKCYKCGKGIGDGFDWGAGKYSGEETGLCRECWMARIDRICDTIHNAPNGPLTALLALDFADLSEERKKEIGLGAEPTQEEKTLAIARAKESGYLENVSNYTLEITV